VKLRVLIWSTACGLVVLASRSLAYALAPRPQLVGMRLERAVGGPDLVVISTGALVTAFAVAAALVWIAKLSVRERHLVAGGPDPQPLRLGRTLAGAFGLFVVSSSSFTLLESYLHWRAGLGWHGIHCLVGPVHRDAIPLLAAFSLVASAAIAGATHLVNWMRRTLDAVARAGVRLWPRSVPRGVATSFFLQSRTALVVRSRGPPPLSFAV
jgi:hypothetical protein